MGTIDNQTLDSFDHKAPRIDQVDRIENIRTAVKAAARAIMANVECGPDRTCALRKLHESMMTANKAIVLERVKVPGGVTFGAFGPSGGLIRG